MRAVGKGGRLKKRVDRMTANLHNRCSFILARPIWSMCAGRRTSICCERFCEVDVQGQTDVGKRRIIDKVAEIANTFEWLITAFILAFIFRAFVMEAFRIPTGSMADTLMGAHFRLRCRQCGYKYRYGLGNFRQVPRDTVPKSALPERSSRCPSCSCYQPTGGMMPISNGDRILVLKCLYQFFEPKQWDVIVFKNPLNPAENYIKRLVGRPGETVEIIDGDIYINGQISRKPRKMQEELWMVVYDNDYQPARPQEPQFNGHKWVQPLRNLEDSSWEPDEGNATVFVLDSRREKVSTLYYDSSVGNDFRATYAYDDVSEYRHMPYCSDLMVRLRVRSGDNGGAVGAQLSKYGIVYEALVDSSDMVLSRVAGGEREELAREDIGVGVGTRGALFEFANVDHKLVLEFGDKRLDYDLGRGPDDAGERQAKKKSAG